VSIVPPKRPELSFAFAQDLILAAGLKQQGAASPPLVVLGRRGYYRDTMGEPGQNDRGIYDDAIALVTPTDIYAFNANTDPSRHGGALAVLQPGVWWYKLGTHHPGTPNAYECLVQAGPVTVKRDNGVVETGEFYIHIHRGGYNLTSSLGCQTIWPDQYDEFLEKVKMYMKMFGESKIPYLLTEHAP